MSDPIVTIVMPAFNVASYLDRSVDSILKQTVPNWELIIVDDCSTDNTAEVGRSWAKRDIRIKFFQQDDNYGPSAARNCGFRLARGQYIGLLDADDAWHPERLARMLQIAKSRDADLVIDNLIFYDEHADCVTGTAFLPTQVVRKVEISDVINSEHPKANFRMGFLKPIFRKHFIRSNNIEYWTEVRLAEDFLLLCESLLAGGRVFLSGWPGYIYTTQIGAFSGRRSLGSRTAQRYWDRVLIAERLLSNPAVKRNIDFMVLVKSYRKWMYSSWQISEITALRGKSFLSALLFSLSNPSAALRYIVGSRAFKKFLSCFSFAKRKFK